MIYADGLKVKVLHDYTDGDVEDKFNKFLRENPNIEIIEIKYVLASTDSDYGNERVLILYREG